jgi:hypothetical protein
LERALGRIVSVALAAGAAAGCHSSSGEPPDTDASSDTSPPAGDATVTPSDDAPSFDDAANDAGLDAAWPEACEPVRSDASDQDPDGCATATFHTLSCGLPPQAKLEGCNVDLATCVGLCQGDFFLYCVLGPSTCADGGLLADSDAAPLIECVNCPSSGGRRPRGLRTSEPRARRPGVGAYFAAMAHLEAASVRAFRDLEGALGALGAPRSFSRRARLAAADERRHARATSRLARRFGGLPPRPTVARSPLPSLFELLHDNAVEGCVGETFGALLATWQAERAADARIRATLRRIAVDEVRHAALAWDLFAWGALRVTPAERTRLEAALGAALRALASRAGSGSSAAVQRLAGHPSVDAERRLLEALGGLVRREANRVA